MKVLYLDVFSGISGDMFVGAMLDLGVEFKRLESALKSLSVAGYHLHSVRSQKSGIQGVKFDVHLADATATGHTHEPGELPHEHSNSHPHADGSGHTGELRNFKSISRLIAESALSPWVKERAIAVFRRVAVAEGKVHGLPPDAVHFHEVGALDSIIDIVGACLCIEMLGCPRVFSSAVVEGTGWVKCAHGRLPVPTMATLEILGARGIAVTQCEEPHELVTPTGAAILAEFVETFGPMTQLVPHKVGYGLGTRDNRTRPNVLRAILGESAGTGSDLDWDEDRIIALETNLDDVSGEILGHFAESTLRAGALDVFHTPIQMKKNRPGTLLTILCKLEDADRFAERLLRQTSAFGVRRIPYERRKLKREFLRVKTEFGEIPVKIGRLAGEVIQVAPEFDGCRDKAVQAGVPVQEVFDAAKLAAKAILKQ
jgi:uncharacterized protein (TIGR00299 family) protein